MPELHTIAGEQVLNLNTKEAFARSVGSLDIDQGHLDALYDSVDTFNAAKKQKTDYNSFPVITQNNEFVLPQGGIFSDRELKVALELGHIVCDPEPNPTHGARVNGSSIDVSMGHYFYKAGEHNGAGIFNPFSREDTLRYFNIKNPETDFEEAKPWGEVREGLRRDIGTKALERLGAEVDYLENIPEDFPMILLRPNERILTHTHEFIGIRPPGTTAMQARSTTGRIGLSACYCAGWGDPGYINRWTMEVHNLNENEYLPVPVGYRMAQLVFSMTGPVGTEYAKATGNYQQHKATGKRNLARIKKDWRQFMMLPQAHKSEIVLPTALNGLAEGIK